MLAQTFSKSFGFGRRPKTAIPSPIDPYAANVVSLLTFKNGTPVDATGKVWTSTGSATVSSDYSKFGAQSLKNVDTGYLSCTHPDFSIGSNDAFTIEMFVKIMEAPSYQVSPGVFELRQTFAQYGGTDEGLSNGFSFSYYLDPGSGQYFQYQIGTINDYAGQSLANYASLPKPLDWVHVALVREPGTRWWKFFVDGVWNGQVSSTNIDLTVNSQVRLGYGPAIYNDNTRTLYIDQFRFTKGVARYTNNFTPPTAPFPNG